MGVLSKKRKGRITASAIGAILGVNPYQSADDVMRRMVREYFGAEPEFTGNDATQYGHDHEAIAIGDYELDTGFDVERDPKFAIHKDYDWLGCTPDGLIGDDGLLEVKCPYYAKEPYTLESKPFYYAQVCLQIMVTDRAWCEFYCWTPEAQHREIVTRAEAEEWWRENFKAIAAFWMLYNQIIADEKLAKPHLEDLELDLSNDEDWLALTYEYKLAKERMEEVERDFKLVKDSLLNFAKEKGKKCSGDGVMVYKATRKGNVQYKDIEALSGVNLDDYRAKDSTYWVVK